MGAGGSSEREVTIEQDDDNESVGPSVKVTEDFVRQVYNMSMGKDDEDSITPKPSKEYTEELLWYKDKLKEEQKKNAEYEKIRAENFNRAAEEVKQKFESTPMARLVPICKDLEQQMLQCYKQNPGRSLDCSDVVRSYQHCVNNARKGVLAK